MKRQSFFIVLAIIFVEWLDFSLYLYLAGAVFSHKFFAESQNSLALSFALFAAGYLARPLGGFLFGGVADKHGRRKPMLATAALMGIATIGICFLPEYSQIGSWATLLLLCFRIMQGIAIGGEIKTSGMFLIEHNRHKPMIAGSYSAAAGALGMCTGGAIAALLQFFAITHIWRLVFLIVGLGSLYICKLRKEISESPEFEKVTENNLTNAQDNILNGYINIATGGIFVSITVYILNVFWMNVSQTNGLLTPVASASIGALAQALSAITGLILARVLQKKNPQIIMENGMRLVIIVAPMLFFATNFSLKWLIFASLLGYIACNGLICASLFYFLYRQLPTQKRCLGVSTVWAIAASFGACSLPICQYVVNNYNFYMFPGIFTSLLALTCLLVLKRKPSVNAISHKRATV